MLKSLKFKYELVHNGKAAIEKVLENKDICLIFMDCNMPLMNGWEASRVLNEIMEKGEIQDIPIIACTGYYDEESTRKCIDAGMEEILRKPVMKNDLINILEKYNLIELEYQ